MYLQSKNIVNKCINIKFEKNILKNNYPSYNLLLKLSLILIKIIKMEESHYLHLTQTFLIIELQ